MKAWCFNYIGYNIIPMESHLVFEAPAPLDIKQRPLILAGGIIRPGQLIRGMFGPHTCAGYLNFHPVAPAAVRYLGTFEDLHGEIAVCNNPDWTDPTTYIGWYIGRSQSTATLISLTKSQYPAGRHVNTDTLFLDDNMPPLECLDDPQYWKKLKKRLNPPSSNT